MDLIVRLRNYADSEPHQRGGRVLCGEALNEIERLRRLLRSLTMCSTMEHVTRVIDGEFMAAERGALGSSQSGSSPDGGLQLSDSASGEPK